MILALAAAHQKISGYMARAALGDFPINLCHVDREKVSLVVGLPDPAATEHYRRFLRQRIGDVALTFVRCDPAIRHAKKKEHNRPLIGGLLITSPDIQVGREQGTICIVATRGADQGFVTAGHVAERVGVNYYQPRKSDQNNWLAGTVVAVSNYAGNAQSDSAFLASTTGLSHNSIWKNANSSYTVTGIARGLALGTQVFMQGAVLVKEQSGQLAAINVTVTFEDGGVLTNQWLANYDSRKGDSGAPVYVKDNDPNVRLVGLNAGAAEVADVNPAPNQGLYPPAQGGTYGVISPWDHIVNDVGVAL